MKIIKIFLSALFIIISFTVNAQLKVFQDGSVSIGGTISLPWPFKLQVAGNTVFSQTQNTITSAAMIRGLNDYSSSSTPDFTWFNNDKAGLFHPSVGVIGFSTDGIETMRISSTNRGQVAIGGNPISTYKFTIYGSAFAFGGNWVPSDIRHKKNIKPIKDALNKVLGMHGKSFEYKTDEFKSLNFTKNNTLGFLTQEIAEILPEAVKIDSNGFYSMNYDEVIPVLVEAIKQQNTIIRDLQQQIYECLAKETKIKQEITMQSENNDINKSLLYQNKPNPFKESTTINYYIDDKASTTKIFIFNMQGKLLKALDIPNKGKGNLIIHGSEFTPGMYMYSLVVDDKEIDTKRMILTEN